MIQGLYQLITTDCIWLHHIQYNKQQWCY